MTAAALAAVSAASVVAVRGGFAGGAAPAAAGDSDAPSGANGANAANAARAGAEDARRRRRNEIVEAVERAAPSVVSISTTQLVPVRYFDWDFLQTRQANQEQKGLGSGVIVHSLGLVVTNAHVINRADQVMVRLTGLAKDAPEIPATILAADLDHDLALLRLDRPGPYPAARFGRSDDLMPGETVIAIGNPLGLGRTVSTGVVSALDRSITVQDRTFGGLVQTDAAINPGNSGGALLNVLGDWIGVNSAIYSMSGGSDGVSFAISMETVNQFLSRSIQSGRAFGRWIGCEFADDPSGAVRIATVYAVGPAKDAKIPEGARIVEIAGRSPRGLGDATLALAEAVVSGKIEIVYESADGGGRRRATIAFEEPPTARLAWERLGIRASEVTPQVRAQTGYPVGSGIVVTEVREGGPAARVGMQPNDLLISLGERGLSEKEDLLDVVQRAARGEVTRVILARPERTRLGIRVERYTAKLTVE